VTYAQSRTVIPDYDLCSRTAPFGTNQCKRSWGNFHTAIINFALCDGSVRAVQTSVDMNIVIPALATIAGGDVVPDNHSLIERGGVCSRCNGRRPLSR
jgi:hypothetical protein